MPKPTRPTPLRCRPMVAVALTMRVACVPRSLNPNRGGRPPRLTPSPAVRGAACPSLAARATASDPARRQPAVCSHDAWPHRAPSTHRRVPPDRARPPASRSTGNQLAKGCASGRGPWGTPRCTAHERWRPPWHATGRPPRPRPQPNPAAAAERHRLALEPPPPTPYAPPDGHARPFWDEKDEARGRRHLSRVGPLALLTTLRTRRMPGARSPGASASALR